jgi:hypothetical protein
MVWSAAALAQIGRDGEANEMIVRYQQSAQPWIFASHIRYFKRAEDREHYAEALRKAGFVEDPS